MATLKRATEDHLHKWYTKRRRKPLVQNKPLEAVTAVSPYHIPSYPCLFT